MGKSEQPELGSHLHWATQQETTPETLGSAAAQFTFGGGAGADGAAAAAAAAAATAAAAAAVQSSAGGRGISVFAVLRRAWLRAACVRLLSDVTVYCVTHDGSGSMG